MAITLPTFADVGVNDPRSVGTQPTYPANDAVAEGTAALGAGITKVGGAIEDYAADADRRKAKLEQANATTDLFIRLTPLHEQISKETDPGKLAELRAQYDQLLPTSGTGISDPYARKLWEATHAKAIFQAKADADSRNTVLDRNRADAEVFGRIDQAVRVGAAADDPQAFENAKLTIKNNLDYYQQYGNLSPTHRYELNKKAQTDLVEGRALSLINKGRVDEASALLEQNRTDLGAARAGNLEHKIEQRGSANRVDGVVNELIGGAGGRSVTPQQGDVGQKVAATLRSRGWSDAAIVGALNNGITESSLKAWNNPGAGGEQGVFQFHPGSHLPVFKQSYNGDTSPEAQANYVADWAEQNMPGYAQSGDARSATARFFKEFERPKDQSDERLAERGGNTPKAQAILAATGAAAAAKPLAVGDSIAAQLIRNTDGVAGKEYGKQVKPDSTATVGANPQQILGAINALPSLGGQDVVLSTGLSNAPDQAQLATVADQIKALKAKGAGNVTVLGLGSRADVAPLNDPLAKVAADNGATFAGPLRKVQSDGIHSSDAKDLLLQAQAVGKAQPIPTGPQAVAGGVAPATGPNRTGLRLPEEVAQEIMSDPRLRNEQERYQALQRYEARYKAQEATQAQVERIAIQRAQQQLRDAENETFADVYSANPKITPQMIATDPRFNIKPESRKAMIELINNPPGSGIPAPQSYNAALSLVERIRLPEGDPNKITTEDQVYPLMRTMNRTDFDYVRKTLNDVRGPGGERLAQTEERFFKDIGPFIDKSNPLAGTMDPAGKARLYEYRRWVDGKKDELKAAGKNPDDLFNPGSPAYIGKPEIVSYYQPTLQQSMKSLEDFAKGVPSPLAPLAPWNPPPIPGPLSNAARQPNETPEQYLKRTGQQ